MLLPHKALFLMVFLSKLCMVPSFSHMGLLQMLQILLECSHSTFLATMVVFERSDMQGANGRFA